MLNLIDLGDLQRTIPRDAREVFDVDLAEVTTEIVSTEAVSLAGDPDWQFPDDVPARLYGVLLMAARRLYLNPGRIASEREGDYSITWSHSATDGDIFTDDEKAKLLAYGKKSRLPRTWGSVKTTRGFGSAREPIGGVWLC